MPPRRVDQLIAAGLFVLALAIRLIGIGWGLPNDLHNQSYHPDEPINYAVSREVSPAKFDFAPGFYNYGTLYFTVLRVAGDMAHAYGSAGDDPWKQAAAGHMAGRMVSALAGAGTILFVFLMLRRFAGRFGAVFGALLIAFAPAHVVHSRFQTPDVFATFLIAVSLYFSLRIGYSRAPGNDSQTPGNDSQAPGNDSRDPGDDSRDPDDDSRNPGNDSRDPGNDSRGPGNDSRDSGDDSRDPGDDSRDPGDDSRDPGDGSRVPDDGFRQRRTAFWAGVFAGLAAGTKYTGALALLPLFVALALSGRKDWWKGAIQGVAASLIAFIPSTPGVLTDTAKFMQDFIYELGHSASGHGLVFVGYGSGFAFHFTNLILGVGFLLTILGLIGLVGGAVKKQPWAWVALALFVPYFILIGRAEIFFMRYTFPLYLGLALGFGWLMDLANQRKRNWLLVVVLGIVGLFGMDYAPPPLRRHELYLGGLKGAATMTYWMASEDPRDAAARYLKEKAKEHAMQPREQSKPDVLVVGLPSDPWFYTPPLYPNTALPRSIPAATRDGLRWMSIPRVAFVPFGPDDRSPWNLELLTRVKPDYVVYSSFEYADVSRLQGVPGWPPEVQIHVDRAKAFADRLKQDYDLDRIFGKQAVLVHDMEYIRPNIWVWKRKSSKTP